MDDPIKLRDARRAAGMSQTELARRAGMSRQALSAIETGAYQPGIGAALRLARVLATTVETLFGEAPAIEPLLADCLTAEAREPGTRVSLARIGGRLIAVPMAATGVTLTNASGLVARSLARRRIEVTAFRSAAAIGATVIIAGCDPGVTIVRDYLARHHPAIELAALPGGSSGDALQAAAQGGAHAAGVHLRDPRTGDYNVAAARAVFGRRRFRIVNFARWELGLATRRGGPAITTVEDLTQPRVRLINRPTGAGARTVLDEMLEARGIATAAIDGYANHAPGHLEVAAAIADGNADAGVTIRLAANLYGLNFQPWREERYDFVIPEQEFHLAPMQSLIEALNTRALANEIGQLCAYDASQMGTVVAPS
jgi:molybdate-binding protein/DNA-binding XRE family transcriptional regulator